MSMPTSPPPIRKYGLAAGRALTCMRLVSPVGTRPSVLALFRLLEETQCGANDLAGILVLAGGDLSTDERIQRGRQGHVSGLV